MQSPGAGATGGANAAGRIGTFDRAAHGRARCAGSDAALKRGGSFGRSTAYTQTPRGARDNNSTDAAGACRPNRAVTVVSTISDGLSLLLLVPKLCLGTRKERLVGSC